MHRHSTQDILIFIVFSMFAILSLVLVAVGVKFYNNISDKTDENSEIRACISYLDNKLRSYDYAGGVSIGAYDGTDVIILSDSDNPAVKTVIYASDGKLKEYLALDSNVILGYGDDIASVDSMTVTGSDNNINITLEYNADSYVINKTMYAAMLME